MYHAVDLVEEDPHALCVPPERFEAQMAWLSRRRWRGVSMRELLAKDARSDKHRLLGLTFDDGYASFRSHALPILEHMGFTASVYISSAHIGGTNAWDAKPRLDLMGREDLVDLHSKGMEVGSHAVHHHALTSLAVDARALELSESLATLSSILGSEVQGLSYPYGDVDWELARQAEAAGYTYAVAYKRGDRADPWLLPRRYIGREDIGLRLAAKLALSR